MTLAKICGITNLADARYAAGAGADLLGFIQHPGSPRFVEPKQIREMIEWIHGPRSVGVFVDVPSDQVNRIAAEAGFDYVQLHGNESPEDCRAIDRPVIKAVHVGGGGVAGSDTAEGLAEIAARYRGAVSHLLLDTARTGLRGDDPGEGLAPQTATGDDPGEGFAPQTATSGGTGRVFDWVIIPDLDVPFFLAGGLGPDNVSEAIRSARPFGVDVSSGVEESPGRKDFVLIDRFMAAVRTA
jgi:phosphoribosylanthranilate isomerase